MGNLSALIAEYNLEGLLVGAATFLIIGLFHPLVIKGEYYFGTSCRVAFALLGIVMCALSLAVQSQVWSILAGVVAFSSFWSIKEVTEQRQRVLKGWFPRNPARNDYDAEPGTGK
ncbi:MAG: DUF4491 family protein [Muribaculaceae bacterium]|nr:DUF4491 family protein [Muribaculaceae bacterium]